MQSKAVLLLVAGLLGGATITLMAGDRISGSAGLAQASLADSVATALAEAGAGAKSRVVPDDAAQIHLSFAPVARTVQPAVVNIFTARVVRRRQQMGPFFSLFDSQPRVENALGSGVIVDGKGLVITNNHVVDGADQIVVAMADRREFPARLLFAEPRLDLALLQIDPKGAELPVARLGDSDRIEVGDLVLAIGNPFGVGQTVTQGIVSATARTGIGVSDAQFFIQTDAAINQGNSGGALAAMNGEVIGINSAILTGADGGGSIGLGFAIPSNMVKAFLRGADSGRFVTAWAGIEGESLTADTARRANLPTPSGVLVSGVSAGSPAAKAGIRVGDIVYAVDGKEVADPSSLRYRIASRPVGGTVLLTIVRGGKADNLQMALAAPPETPARDLTRLPNGSIFAGVTIANLSPALAQELGAGLPERGVVVVTVSPQAPAAGIGFPRPGDTIERVNGQPVARVGDVADSLRQGDGATSFILRRSGQQVECRFQPPASFGCRAA